MASKSPWLLPSRCLESADKNSQVVTKHTVWCTWQYRHISRSGCDPESPVGGTKRRMPQPRCSPPLCVGRAECSNCTLHVPAVLPPSGQRQDTQDRAPSLLGSPSSSSVRDASLSLVSFSLLLTYCPLPLSGSCTCGFANDFQFPNTIGSCRSLITAVTSLRVVFHLPWQTELSEDRGQV